MPTETHRSDPAGKLIVGLMKCIGVLPLPLAGILGRLIGHLAWFFASTPKYVTLRNIELCFPHLNAKEQQLLAKSSLIETLQTALEIAVIWSNPGKKTARYISHIENEALIKDAQKSGKGVVLIAPHFGNWELTNFYIAKHYPFLVMYKPADQPALNQFIYQSRSASTEMVPANKKGVITLFRALKNGKVTGVLPDQEPTTKTGVWAPFFGVPALTPKLVSKLVNDTNSIALGFGCQRNPDGKSYHLFFIPVEPELYNNDVSISATALNRCVEAIINRDPKQYQWEYKRFKRRPDKEPSLYK